MLFLGHVTCTRPWPGHEGAGEGEGWTDTGIRLHSSFSLLPDKRWQRRSPELSGRPACPSSGLKKKKMWPCGRTYVTPADSDQPLLLRFLQRETDKEPSSSSLAAMTESDTAAGQRQVALSPRPSSPPSCFGREGDEGGGECAWTKNMRRV